MKKLLKDNLKIIVLMLITSVVATTTTIFAYSLIAENIGFTPKDINWDVQDVEAALNNLNLRVHELSTFYSDEEKVIGKWLDGKTLYRKTISFTIPSGSPYQGNIKSIDVSNVDTIMISGGYFNQGHEWNQLNTYYTPDCYSYMSVYKTNDVYYLHMRQKGFSNKPAVAVIDYTKTTD